MTIIQTIRFWLKNSRYTALPQSLLPAIVAVAIASGVPGFSWILAIIAVFGVIVGHLGMNLFDDYFDYRKKGTDFREEMIREGIRARIAKCSYITSGEATLKQLGVACIIFCLVALVPGIIIWLQRGNGIVYLALLTGFLGISYSGIPLRFSYHGWGELLIGFMFGPLLMMGVYFSACGVFDLSLLWIACPIGLLVANILYTHSIMDYEPDKRAGKMTLAVLLRNRNTMLVASFLMIFVPFLLVIYAVVVGILSISFLLVLLTLPMGVSLFYLMVQYTYRPQRVFTPKYWMGPMDNWQYICDNGIEWFMIRWFLARNLLTFFCLVIVMITIVHNVL